VVCIFALPGELLFLAILKKENDELDQWIYGNPIFRKTHGAWDIYLYI